MNFFTKKDTVYFIRISSYFEDGTNLSMNCLDIPEYNCDHPSPVICGDMIELNTKKTVSYTHLDVYKRQIHNFLVILIAHTNKSTATFWQRSRCAQL